MVDLVLKDESNQEQRIKSYIQQYGSDFFNCLCDEYVKRGLFRSLLDQSDEYNRMLDVYLQNEGLSWLSWIHDLKLTNFDRASATLWHVADHEQSADRQLVIIFW